MGLKQRLDAFSFCVDCRKFTLTGWRCWKCHRRLCFACAGGWAMSYGYSPGFETCQSCKDEYAKAMDARLVTYMETYQPRNKKRRCTSHTPLTSTEHSSRLFMQKPIYLALSELKSRSSLQKIWRFDWRKFATSYQAVKRFSAYLQPFSSIFRAQYFIFHCQVSLWVSVGMVLLLIVHNTPTFDNGYKGIDMPYFSMVS